MTTIAHLTDLHLIEEGWQSRRGEDALRLRFCSLLRPRDPEARRERLRRGLRAAMRARADHVVITGDLTEDGYDAAFETLADELGRGPFPPEAVTVVPGNHDAYTDGAAFARALVGPLRPWARTSTPGAVTRIGSTVIVALSTAVHQHYTRSYGALGGEQLVTLRAMATVRSFARGVVVLAMHHPPFGMRLPPMNWLDGLVERSHLKDLVAAHSHVHVLHGHTHREEDRAVAKDRAPQVFSAAAVVEAEDPIRLYEAGDGRLWPTTPALPLARPVPVAATVAAV
jgi:3',5'-cyclic AMP phosphodiesterase CpdA